MKHHFEYRIEDDRALQLQTIIREIENLITERNFSSSFIKLLKNDLFLVREELGTIEYNTQLISTVFDNLETKYFYFSKKAWSRNNNKPWPRLLRQFNPIHDIKYVWAINKVRNEIIYDDHRMLKSGGFKVNQIGKINANEVYAYCKDIEQFNLINQK